MIQMYCDENESLQMIHPNLTHSTHFPWIPTDGSDSFEIRIQMRPKLISEIRNIVINMEGTALNSTAKGFRG